MLSRLTARIERHVAMSSFGECGAADEAADVVHEDVEPAQPVDRLLDGRLDLCLRRRVDLHGQSGPPTSGAESLEQRSLGSVGAVGDDDAGSGLGQGDGDRRSDAHTAARDEGGASVQWGCADGNAHDRVVWWFVGGWRAARHQATRYRATTSMLTSTPRPGPVGTAT
jgi:hypothetical protein